MTYRFSQLPRHWALVPVLVLLSLAAAGFVVEAGGSTAPQTRVLVVVDTAGARDPALVRAAEDAVRRAERAGAEAEMRVTRTPTDQLSVTHYFAARGFDAIVGAGLDRDLGRRHALIARDGAAHAARAPARASRRGTPGGGAAVAAARGHGVASRPWSIAPSAGPACRSARSASAP